MECVAVKAKYVPLSSRLRYYRKQSGYTQDIISKLIGVSRQSISAYENGNVEPDLATLRKLASIYKVSMDVLLDLEKSDSATDRKTVKKELDAAQEAIRIAAQALEESKVLLDKL